jgi:hypothetical protein
MASKKRTSLWRKLTEQVNLFINSDDNFDMNMIDGFDGPITPQTTGDVDVQIKNDQLTSILTSEKELDVNMSDGVDGPITLQTSVVDVQTNTHDCLLTPDSSNHAIENDTVDDDNDDWLNALDEEMPWFSVSDTDDCDVVPPSEKAPEDSVERENMIRYRLADWAVRHNITHTALGALLTILQLYFTFLPRDPRTLLQTKHNKNIVEKCKGSYIYFGVVAGLTRSLLTLKSDVPNDTISLSISVDGLPLYKSSGHQFWPILAKYCKTPPFIVALYYGLEKPKCVEEYLRDFVNEMKALLVDGLVVGGKKYTILLKSVIADAPARAFLKCVKMHNSYFGCDRCTAKGAWIEGRVTYPELDAPLRTNIGFSQNQYTEHQCGISPLNDICPELVTRCSLDYMHLVCLGVVRRMCNFWKKGHKNFGLGGKCIEIISKNLLSLADNIPSDFVRKPRSLQFLDRFKATEFRLLLLYSGPVALKGVLSSEMYTHFMSLSLAMHILLSPKRCVEHCNYARELLRYFVANCHVFYGKAMVVYNVHSLLHIADDVENFKCALDNLSAFPFENYMQQLKRYVRSTTNPLQQVANRAHEIDIVAQTKSMLVQLNATKDSEKKHAFSCLKRDNCYLLRKKNYIFITEIRTDDSGSVTLVCDVCPAVHAQSWFTKPCDSKLVQIGVIKAGYRFKRALIEPTEILCKCMALPVHEKGIVVIPLVSDDTHY